MKCIIYSPYEECGYILEFGGIEELEQFIIERAALNISVSLFPPSYNSSNGLSRNNWRVELNPCYTTDWLDSTPSYCQ